MTPTAPEVVHRVDEDDLYVVRNLTLARFSEALSQSTQRGITVGAFALIAAARPEVQCVSEMLVLYPAPELRRGFRGVVPDSMVIVHPTPIRADGYYDLRTQPGRPLLVLESESDHTQRKFYDESRDIFERDIGVPYYLLHDPERDRLEVSRLAGGRYVPVVPNAAGRLPIPELELEVARLDGWVRYWFRGELLPLSGELLRQRDAERAARLAAERERDAERQRADAERQARLAVEAEVARLREELARAKGA